MIYSLVIYISTVFMLLSKLISILCMLWTKAKTEKAKYLLLVYGTFTHDLRISHMINIHTMSPIKSQVANPLIMFDFIIYT